MRWTDEIWEFAVVLMKEAKSSITLRQFENLVRQSIQYNELIRAECNTELSQKQQRYLREIEDHFELMGKKLGVSFKLDGDPRGFVVKLMTPKTGLSNMFVGGEGWGIPNIESKKSASFD